VGVAASELSEGWNLGFVVCSLGAKDNRKRRGVRLRALAIFYKDVRIFRFEFERKKRMAALIEFR
jgi:hypothetical protein